MSEKQYKCLNCNGLFPKKQIIENEEGKIICIDCWYLDFFEYERRQNES